MSSPQPIAIGKANNRLLRCSLPRCSHNRYDLSIWCRKHHLAGQRLGHPDAKAYSGRDWSRQRQEVEALLQENRDHKGVLEVTQLVSDLMLKAAASENAYKGAKEMRRMLKHGITASTVVAEFAACWLWQNENPAALPSDTARDVCLSRCVFLLAPRERRACGTGCSIPGNWRAPTTGPKSYGIAPRTSALKFVGRHLRMSLSAFLANVVMHVEADRARKADPVAHQRAPMRSPAVASSRPC